MADGSPTRRPLPTGTVTFLRTDVEGSMQLTRALGSGWDALNATHLAIIRDAVEAHDGIPVRTEGDAMFAAMDDASKPAAAIFRYNPNHRWWYFSNMVKDEALLLKFHDSDHSVAWRTPHTAFWDPSFADRKVRASIECRSIAFFEHER